MLRLFSLPLICLFFCLSFNARAENLSAISEVPSGLWRLGDGTYFSKYALIVDKSKRKVYVVANSPNGPVIADTYDSDLGKSTGDKARKNDYKTPEGIYFFRKMLEGPGLDFKQYGQRAFVTDYPNFWDRKFNKDGSGIWLHAVPDEVGLERGSRGCVVVRNDTIKKISDYINLNLTPMIIYDKVQWISADANRSASDKVLKFLDQWRLTWQKNDLESYKNFYATDFKGNRKMSLEQWINFKKNFLKRPDIQVTLSMPVIYEHRGNLIVRFLQDYKSTEHSDFGEKVLFLRRLKDDALTIVGEEWQPTVDSQRSVLAGANVCCSAIQ